MTSTSDAPRDDEWSFTYERPIHDVFPALHDAQAAWLSQIDSLSAPDRKTHELIRMVCTVIARNHIGIRRHARLAREVGATWEEVLGSIMLTCVAFGVGPAVESIPHARAGFDEAADVETEVVEDDDGGNDEADDDE